MWLGIFNVKKKKRNIPTVHQNNEDLRNSVAVTALEVETYRYIFWFEYFVCRLLSDIVTIGRYFFLDILTDNCFACGIFGADKVEPSGYFCVYTLRALREIKMCTFLIVLHNILQTYFDELIVIELKFYFRYYEKSEKNNHWTGTFAHMNGV